MGRWSGNLVGALVMAGFGLLWWVVGTSGLGALAGPLRIVGLVFGVALMLLLGWRSRRVAGDPPDPPDLPDRAERRFNWIVFIEAGVIVLIVILGNQLGRYAMIPPAITLVVGLAFFPLARLFGQRSYLVLGGLMTLLAIVSFLAVPVVGRTAPFAVSGLGSAVLLWGASVLSLLTSRAPGPRPHPAA